MPLNISKFKVSLGTHRGQSVIWLQFQKEAVLLSEVKQLKGARWSVTQKCWHIPDLTAHRQLFNLPPKYVGKEVMTKIHEVNRKPFERFLEHMKLEALSPNTIKTYSIEFAQLLYILKDFPVDELSPERLRSYFLYGVQTLKLSENTLHSRMNAVKYYYEQVAKRGKLFLDIPRPKKPSLLPRVIDKKDIAKMISVLENPKHKLLLSLCYGMGLRVSEIVGIKITDIDSKRMQVLIGSAKGKKDRYVNLPTSVLEDMRKYYKAYKPSLYLFEGQYGGQYTTRSVQAVFKQAMRKAKINKKVGVHSLRHSYATHLMEYGTDMVFIQKLLGNSTIKTTEIYAKVSTKLLQNVKSPLDTL